MAENKLFVNPKTGQMSATKNADFNQDLDTYTPAQTSSPVPTTAPVAPVTPPPAITTKDIITPPAGVATAANKRGTFASYDPVTGLASNRRALDIGQQGMNDYLETAINGVEYSKNPDQFVITSKNANTLYGFKKPPKQETATTQTAQANAPAQPADPYPDMKKTGNPYMDSLINNSNQYGDDIVRKLAENEDLDTEIDTQNEVVSAINAKKLKMEADLDLENINQSISSMALKEEYYTGKDTIKGNARQMLGDVSSKLTELSSRINEAFDKKAVQEAVTNATNLYQYHLVQNDYNVATGKLQQLEQDSRENADMIFKYQTAMNDISANLFNMDRQTKELKQKEIDREYEMAMQGYSYVPNPAALQELAKKKGTDWVEANTTKIGGKIWIKPDTSKKVVNTIDVGGQLWGLNENGEKIVNYGNSGGFSFSTDENGNVTVTNSKTGEVKTQYTPKPGELLPNGSHGGQCGEYVNNLMGTSFGDSWENKQSKTNLSPAEFAKSPQVGDVLVIKTGTPYGHVAVVTSVADGKVTITESNWGLDEKVGTRTLSVNDKSITGVYRGASFKQPAQSAAPQFSETAKNYAKEILAGRMDISNVPGEEMKNEVINAKAYIEKTEKSTADKLIIEGLSDKIKSFDAIMDHKGMKGTVGPYAIARWTPFSPDKSERQDFIASVEQLISQETIDKLVQSKAAGATYGALSEGEREMLAKSASKIGSWRITDDKGKVVGYEISESLMKTELEKIKTLAERARDRIAGSSVILPPGQSSDQDAYQEYLNTINK